MLAEKTVRSYTIKYALAQALFWMALCAIKGFMSVLLLDRGYTNTQVGIILAVSSIVTVFMQPAVASFADKHREIPLKNIISVFAAVGSLLAALTIFLTTESLALTVVMIFSVIIITVLYPLINSLYVMLGESGIKINYGVGRAAGSLGYALFSLLLGKLLETAPTVILPLSGLFLLIAVTLTTLLLWDKRAISGKDKTDISPDTSSEEGALGVFQFMKRNLRYMLFLFGVALVFYNHTNVSDYLVQVVSAVGGTSTDLGTAVFICAIVELPAMLFFNSLLKKFSCRTLLRISAVSFTVKHLLVLFATNVTTLLISQVF
ncbi:MAG: MFS transporter, partial [Ruminococcaceae bacterium]|nr:MFS transporter [Oscillospiraceae bacterium]